MQKTWGSQKIRQFLRFVLTFFNLKKKWNKLISASKLIFAPVN
jgi:hypothetical protein